MSRRGTYLSHPFDPYPDDGSPFDPYPPQSGEDPRVENCPDELFRTPKTRSYEPRGSSTLSCGEKRHSTLNLWSGTLSGGRASQPPKNTYLLVAFEKVYVEERMASLVLAVDTPNMKIPTNPDRFEFALQAAQTALEAGKHVHAGCIGGHGRTGTFVACIAHRAGLVIGDPVRWTREHYCRKAVESVEQERFVRKVCGFKG